MERARQALRAARRRVRFTAVALVAAAVGAGVAVWSRRAGFGELDWDAAGSAFAAAVALFAVAPLVQAVTYWLILRSLGRRSALRETVPYWTRSFLLRYAPTGALGYVFRVKERGRVDARTADVLTATVYEQLVALLAGAGAVVASFVLTRGQPPLAAVVALAAAAGLAAFLRPRWGGQLVRSLLARRGIELSALLAGRTIAALVAVSSAGWIATGAAVAVLVNALAAGPAPDPVWLAGSYALAWLAGYLVPFLPAGLGVRDGTLAGLLALPFGAGTASALAVTLRLANTLGELVAIGLVELGHRTVGRGARTRSQAETPLHF